MFNILIFFIFLVVVSYVAYSSKGDGFFLSSKNSSRSLGISYGATLISTSALIGFGGLASWTGFSFVFLSIVSCVISIYLSTTYIGPKIWELNQKYKAKTIFELWGSHFGSQFLRKSSAMITILLLPFYCTAILIGVGKVIASFTDINYIISILVFSGLAALSVTIGGMKSVLKNDQVLGIFMITGALAMLTSSLHLYVDNNFINNLNSLWYTFSPDNPLNKMGFTGYFSMPEFLTRGWILIVTLTTFTISLGLIAVPQLQTRYMLAKNQKSFKSIAVWSMITTCVMLAGFSVTGVVANNFYWVNHGQSAVSVAGGTANVIPMFLNSGFPEIIGSFLFLVIIASAFTTLNSLMHLLITTVTNDILTASSKNLFYGYAILFFTIMLSLWVAITFDKQPAIIARVTAVYFGVLGSALLPSILGLLVNRINKHASNWSFVAGSIVSLFWLLFIHAKESQTFTGVTLLDLGAFNFIESIVPGLAVSLVVYFALYYAKTCNFRIKK